MKRNPNTMLTYAQIATGILCLVITLVVTVRLITLLVDITIRGCRTDCITRLDTWGLVAVLLSVLLYYGVRAADQHLEEPE